MDGTYSISIAPGPQGSDPGSLTPVGNKLYFSANDRKNGRELWVTDGIDQNTKKIYTFLEKKSPSQSLVLLGEKKLYFFDGENSTEGLWQFDIENEKALLVYPITGRKSLVSAKTCMFFWCEGSSGSSIWISDGSLEGTKQLIPENAQDPILSIERVVSGDKGHYLALNYHNYSRTHLWYTKGDKSNTYMIKKNINEGQGYHETMIAINDTLYFRAYDLENGGELWKADGDVQNTAMIWDIYPGAKDGNPMGFTLFNETLFFTGNDEETGCEIRTICPDILSF